MKSANGPSPLDNMRNLEHYLNEISTGDSTEQQLKESEKKRRREKKREVGGEVLQIQRKKNNNEIRKCGELVRPDCEIREEEGRNGQTEAGKEEELGKETKWKGIELRNPTTAKLRTAKGAFFTSLAFPPNRESSRIKGELRIS
ncbi:hypothetical protein M8J75_007494 [Diaphorina citri]|nr:hypothetical protein M8J75_007494 [Diaphorina citri]KAI5747680.1 hypothetical protein M8J77_017413 [Diaphorina citri]